MRIVWVSHSGALLGAERCLLEGSKALMAHAVDVHAILPSSGALKDSLDAVNVPVSIIPCSLWMSLEGQRSPVHRLWHLYRTLSAWRKLARLLAHIRPDLVVTNTVTIPFGALAARSAGIPHVWYLHEFGAKDHGLQFDFGTSISLSLVDRLSARIVVTSAAVRDEFARSLPASKLRVIPPAVDIRETPPTLTNHTGLSLVLVGAVVPGKRQEDAVRAVARLVRNHVDVRLTIVGHGSASYLTTLHRLVSDLGVTRVVQFSGFTTDPFSYLSAADVALVCSRHEAFGRVTVEAMKLGKPVIAADCGGTLALIRDGWNGVLYRSEDVEDLSRKIEILYHDRALRDEIGRNAKEWSTLTFTLDKYSDALRAVFAEAVHDRAAGSVRP